ncbi:MAG: chromosomal replication initiator protein DnaA [Clostridia bacterium]|nr:chromosomal replication initiator protein DnaA [Clostridia bacterium]
MSDNSTYELDALYNTVIENISRDRAISSEALNLWFENCRLTGMDDDFIYLSVSSESRKNTIQTHYAATLKKYFSKELGRDLDVAVFVSRDKTPAGSASAVPAAAPKVVSSFRRNPSFTFDNYVVGSSNIFAYTAAKSIAEKTSSEFNPFFIYGPSGIGKTHLLWAIANKIAELYPEKVIVYEKGEEFTNSFVESLKERTMSLFRQKYRSADVLLIDDIQFLAGKKETQEEFFHTFDSLYEGGKQIILSSDRSPSELSVLTDRLQSRFSAALIQDIQLPDFELRLAILRKKSETSGLDLSDEILEYLAEKLNSNIRAIEGVIRKLSALCFLHGVKINMNTVTENVSIFLKEEEPAKVIVSRIISETGKKFDVPVEEILGRRRDKQIQLARNVSMYIIRQITSLSLPEIGLMFERKHSSVKSNIDTVKKNLKDDPFLEKQIEEIIKAVKQ